MSKSTPAPQSETEQQPTPAAPKAKPEPKVPPAVAAIHESLRAQAKVTTRFDATKFRRKERG